MNSSRRYSISVCFVYGLEEKDSKSEFIFAVCRLPLTSCLTSLILRNYLKTSREISQILCLHSQNQAAQFCNFLQMQGDPASS